MSDAKGKSEETTKSKAELKAERRAIQEAQRAAKESKKSAPHAQATAACSNANKPAVKSTAPAGDKKPVQVPAGKTDAKVSAERKLRKIHLFEHLDRPKNFDPIFDNFSSSTTTGATCKQFNDTIGQVSQIFLDHCQKMDTEQIRGSTASCLSFIAAVQQLANEHAKPASKQGDEELGRFSRSFLRKLMLHAFHVHNKCKPLSTMTQSFVLFCKVQLQVLDRVDDWDQCREGFLQEVVNFQREQIELAGEAIQANVADFINNGEFICTYGDSSLVRQVLLHAWRSKRKLDPAFIFSVLVVDSGPSFHGRKMLHELSEAGIPCVYALINAVPSLADKVSMVLISAASLLSNGHVMAQIGSAQVVACLPHAPIIVCSQTCKFWDRAQTDAYEYNELSKKSLPLLLNEVNVDNSCFPQNHPEFLANVELWPKQMPQLHLLNLEFDVIPASLVNAVVTELGTVPTSSVPVILRVKQTANSATAAAFL